MKINKGDRIQYSIVPRIEQYSAIVVSADGANIMLDADNAAQPEVSKGQHLILSFGDSCKPARVISAEGSAIKLEWIENRRYFRVNDVLPIVTKKIEPDSYARARVFSGYGMENARDYTVPDATISPKLWEILVDIDTKLSSLLGAINMQTEGFTGSNEKYINISASGVKFTIKEKVEVGDLLEIKVLLPAYPPLGIVASGEVVRVNDLGNGEYDVALHFSGITDEVTDEIIQYSIKRQREIIHKQRDEGK
ncbi:MAG: PilZ domain-containing protein [Nitrospirae bacterium]|nr:PilZ domain-containing protein [Nitrospirota bacterium]